MKKIHIISLVTIFGLFFLGCEKDALIDTHDSEIYTQVEEADAYFIDNKPVTKNYFQNVQNKSKLPFVIYSGRNNERAIYGYTTELGYITYGDKHNINLEGQLQFEKHMKAYAQKNNLIAEYERTGTIPDSYYEYEAEAYNKFMAAKSNKSVLTEFSKGHNGTGSKVYMVNTFAVMPISWNNAVSSFQFIGVYGVVTLYSRSFYRKSIGTYDGWGYDRINLYGSANNTTSSALSIW